MTEDAWSTGAAQEKRSSNAVRREKKREVAVSVVQLVQSDGHIIRVAHVPVNL